MDYVTDSFSPFTTDDSIVKKCLIGTLVLFASILVLPYFLYQGYLLRILEETRSGVPTELPEWNNLGDLFVNGVVALLISMVITLPAYVIMYGPRLVGAQEEVVLISQLVGSLISLVFSYLTLLFLTLYARDGMDGLLDFKRAKDILLSVEYFVANIALIVGGIIFGLFVFMFSIFTLGIGILLLPFIMPPVNYLFMVIIGTAISEAEGTVQNKDTTDSDDLTGDESSFETGFEDHTDSTGLDDDLGSIGDNSTEDQDN